MLGKKLNRFFKPVVFAALGLATMGQACQSALSRKYEISQRNLIGAKKKAMLADCQIQMNRMNEENDRRHGENAPELHELMADKITETFNICSAGAENIALEGEANIKNSPERQADRSPRISGRTRSQASTSSFSLNVYESEDYRVGSNGYRSETRTSEYRDSYNP